MNPPPVCECSKAPLGWRCPTCVDAILCEKNRLVRENYDLRHRLGLPAVEPPRQEPPR